MPAEEVRYATIVMLVWQNCRRRMGCCGSSAIPAEDDDPPGHMTPTVEAMWEDVEEKSFTSSARSATQPSMCYCKLYRRCLVIHAGITHGITGSMDTTPDDKIYEEVVIPALRPRQTRRIIEWMRRVKPPRRRKRQAAELGLPHPYTLPNATYSADEFDLTVPSRPAHRSSGYTPQTDRDGELVLYSPMSFESQSQDSVGIASSWSARDEEDDYSETDSDRVLREGDLATTET
jgi:hypothetical protein